MSATILALVLSLFSAVAYAAAAVAQERLASRNSGTGVLRLLSHGAWWWSVVLNASAALLHVAALKFGPLTLVQPLGALTLVAAVPLGARVAGRRVTAVEWRGTALTLIGLAALLVTASGPEPDRILSLPQALAVAGATTALIGALSIPQARLRSTGGSSTGGRPGLRHATASGFASGVASALTQTVTVAATDRSGPVLSAQVVVVALLVAAFATGGLLLSQTAYRDGLGAPLAVVTLANPLAAALIGLSLLGERLQGGAAGLILTAAGAALAAWGVVTLSRSAPEPAAVEAPAGAGADHSLPTADDDHPVAAVDDHPVAAVLALEARPAPREPSWLPPQPAPPSSEHLTAL
ncbi:DMT family transporter [Streptomyces yaanensis]|uniref:DMT family transporter n=1 Tax=Streptomyces yaanensis TaxID=1142239 RepID=A0ABV7SAG6_9ACTN|nr:DMT family transporter [Streptomyces sp. CGMCC 4.7035]WNB99168.1 DMT family transporter [Streptomyces sp. CGMCC 4.7035]